MVGGRATSKLIDESNYGSDWFNSGVQGGPPVYRHTYNFFRKYGYEPQEVKLQFAYGKGKDSFCTNAFPTPMEARFDDEIQRFKKVMKLIKHMPSILGIVPIRTLFRTFGFSKEFVNKMVIPLLSLFFGTEQGTSKVSSLMLQHLLDDPNMRLWDYEPNSLLYKKPTMLTFPNMGDFFRDWASDLRQKGVSIRLNTEALRVVQRNKKGIIVHTRLLDADPRIGDQQTDAAIDQECFDDMAMCIFAPDALRILDQTATRAEKCVFSHKFSHNTTVIHTDSRYIRWIYETRFKPELTSTPRDEQQKKQLAFSQSEPRSRSDGWTGYQPMYYLHPYSTPPDRFEISYDCTALQHQFRQDHEFDQPPPPFDRHIFQTTFFDIRRNSLWTLGQLDERKIIERKWSIDLKRGWRHYAKIIPGMICINGNNNTFFAGNGALAVRSSLSVGS